jgi:hypothetical protein
MQRFRPFIHYFPLILFLLPLFVIGGILVFPQQTEAISCPTYTSLSWSCSIPAADGGCGYETGEFCESGQCYIASGSSTNCNSTPTYCTSACTQTTYTYNDSCYSASQGGGCNYGPLTSSTPSANDSCFTNLCASGQCSGGSCTCVASAGTSCTSAANNCGATNSGTVNCDGTCSASAPANVTGLGGACTSAANVCGATNSGTYVCNAAGTGSTCSATTPATPYTVEAACNRNVCGGTGTITNACTGACSASAPTVYTVGAACTSAANNCGATNTGIITDQCTGACSVSAPANVAGLGGACTSAANVCGATNSGTYVCNAAGTGSTCSASTPSNPSSCARCNNVGECNSGYQCSGPGTCSVSAPADRATSCRGGAGGSLSSGVNVGSFPEYYGINNAWNNVTCGPSAIYSCPAGSTTKVYFTYSTEINYDFVKIYNGASSLLEQFSGSSGYTWVGPYAASSLKFGFSSDVSTPGAYFDVWKIECIVPADAAAPTIGVSGAPGSWQHTNATATTTCNDGAGVGCTASANWNWLTYGSSPPANCPTTFPGSYSGTGGGVTITNHVWYCATAADTNGNRGYTSTPVEFKVDKTNPSAPTSVSYSPNPDTTGTPTVSWSGASDTGDSGVASYDVQRSSNGGSTWTAVASSVTSTSWAQSPALGSGTYIYQVKTRDGAENTSGWSTNTNSVIVSLCNSSSYGSCGTADDFAGGGSIGNMCGADQYYKVTVPSGQICDALWSMTPDAGSDYNLYAKWSAGSCSSTSVWDCRPFEGSGQNELCTTAGLGAGTYTALVHKYSGSGSYAIAGSTYSCKTITQLPDTDFSFDPTNITTGGSTTVRGWLKDSAGTGIGDKTVALQCWNGSTWPQVASGTTETVAPNIGYTSFPWAPAAGWSGNVSCRLNFAGDSSYLASTSGQKILNIGNPTPSFPTGTWERLWYADPLNNSFSVASYLGSNTVGTLDNNWGTAQLYGTTAAGTDNGTNRIGFKASRTLTGLTPGTYTISVGADDGIKLFVNGGGNLLPPTAWTDNHSYNDNRPTALVELSSSATIEIHYRENTGDAQVSFSYALAPVAPAPSGMSTDPSDTAIYVAWNSVSGVSGATYRLEWCKKSVIDGGGSFSSPGCGPPNSPAGGPPYFLTTTSTSGYIIGTEAATAYSLRVRVDSGTSVTYIFPGNWASANVTTRTPISCSDVTPINISGGSSVTNDCFQDERRCGPIDTEAGCTAACSLGDNYLSTGLNPIVRIGTVTNGRWRVTGTASYDLFAQGHGVECVGPDWRSWIYNVNAYIYLKYPSPIDTASASQSLSWTVTGEGGQEFSLPNAATLTFDKVFNCPDASCDLWFYSSFSGNTWTHKQFFPGGGGDYVRQLAVMDNNFSWVRVDETPPGVPTIHTSQDQWRKESPATNMTITDDIAVSEIGYALKGKDCDFPADPCAETDWKRAQKSDLSGDLAPSGTSVTTNWKMSNADWGRFDEGVNTLYLRVKDTAGNCRGCDNATKITFGIKKDTLAPTSTLDIANSDARLRSADNTYWFGATGGSIPVADLENITAGSGKYSGLNTTKCSYAIYDVGASAYTISYVPGNRTCGQNIPISVGPAGQCGRVSGEGQSEGQGRCLIYLESYDQVGNINGGTYNFFLNVDRTPPSAQ